MGDKEFITLFKGINSIMNVIARLEFDLGYFDATARHLSPYSPRTPPKSKVGRLKCLYFKHHHHHNVVPQAWISLTFSRHFSLSLIASGWSSGLYPVSSQTCWMYVRAGRPAFARPYVGVHRSTSLMSSSLLLQQ